MLSWFWPERRANGPLFAFRNRAPAWKPGIVQQLAREDPVFLAALTACSQAVEQRLGWSIEELLARTPEDLAAHLPHEQFEPTLTAVQIAQVDAWRGRGVEPAAVMGMCAGEVGAAYAAGVLTLEGAMQVACAISGHATEAMELPSQGGGFGAKLTFEQGLRLQEATHGGVFAAMEWASNRTLFTGEMDAIRQLLPELEKRGVEHFGLGMEGFAAHSPLLDSLKPAFVGRLEGLVWHAPRVPVYSGSKGGLLTDPCFDPEHWWHVITDPVYVFRTLRESVQHGYLRFLEVSLAPDPIFPVAVAASAVDQQATLESSLRCLAEASIPCVPTRSFQPEKSLG